ncbi:MAG TPA: PDZ domain-containing protein, partial [Polyangiaceae bacterium]|nr:PDZ domain-containing protein [Polyangiaceae bacterium]
LHFDLVSSVVDDGAGTTTDEAGAYRLEGAPAGPFTLRVQKQGFRTKLVPGLRVDSGQTLTQEVSLSASGGGMDLAGIGAGLGQNADGIFVAQVFGGDPADRAGLRSGDHIVSIDGEDASNMSVADAVQRLRGQVGTSVGMSIRRGGGTIDMVIERAAIVH